MAGSTPSTWCINACQGGGQNQGMVVRWPKGIKAKGEIRRQYTHLIDVAPTILEAVGIPEPKMVNGVEQIPMAGREHELHVRRCEAKDRHITQYNECSGNRSIYHDGWLACVMHRAPWEEHPRVDDYAKDKWELYHVRGGLRSGDRSRRQDAREAEGDAGRCSTRRRSSTACIPMDDRSFERLNATNAGRPDIMAGRTEMTLYPGMTGMAENVLHRHAQPVLSSSPPTWRSPRAARRGGPLAGRPVRRLEPLRQGWQAQVRVQLARPRDATTIEGNEPLPEGKVTLVYDFTYDGGGLHKGGKGKLFINGRKVGEGRIDKTQGAVWSLAGETADVGMDAYSRSRTTTIPGTTSSPARSRRSR